MSYHRPIRIAVKDTELLNETPSESTSPSTYSSSNLELDNRSSLYDQSSNISPLSAMSYSPERRVPTANRISQIGNVVTDVIPFYTNEDNFTLPSYNTVSTYSTDSQDNMYYCSGICCFINFINLFLFVIFSLLDKTKLDSRNPNDMSWSFYAITPYPECKDVRNQVWRLISYSFVHGNIVHLLGNSIGIIVSTVGITRLQKFHSIIMVYFICIINGALSNYLTHPYLALIGASGGVYGVAGSNVAAIIYNYDSFYSQEIIYFYLFNFFFIMIDVISYHFMYSDNVAYQTHWYCYLFGILSGLIFYDCKTKTKIKNYIRFISLFVFCYLNSLLLFHYIFNYPSSVGFNYFKITKENSCCYDILHFESINNSTFICNY